MSEPETGQTLQDGRPTLTLFCGLPGSGKTTLAKRLDAEGRGVRLCTDDWQMQLMGDHTDMDFHDRLQRLLYRHALTLLERGTSVILEDGLWRTDERTEKFHDARNRGSRIELHIFDVPYDTLWSRLEDRNRIAAPGAYPIKHEEFHNAWNLFQRPSPDELAAVDYYELHSGGRE